MLSVGELRANAGERAAGFLDLNIAGIDVQFPVFLLNGAHPGPTLVVTAGIHGGEYPCVEAASRLGRTVDVATLHGQLLIAPSANPVAFKARSIYITPPDNKNLNRVFPGDPSGTFTEAWAAWLFENVMRQADYYIDMHGGDMIEALVPFVSYNVTGNRDVDEKAEAMAHAYGIRAILVKDDPGGLGGSTYAAAARAGIPALLTEAGGQGVWDEESVSILQSGVRRVMAMLDMYSPIDDPGEPPEVMAGWEWMTAQSSGLFYCTVSAGDQVEKGQPLGRIADVFGTTLEEVEAPVGGEVLFLVTSLAMNAGDPLMAIAYR